MRTGLLQHSLQTNFPFGTQISPQTAHLLGKKSSSKISFQSVHDSLLNQKDVLDIHLPLQASGMNPQQLVCLLYMLHQTICHWYLIR